MRSLPFLLLVACADSGSTEASGLADEVAALTATIDDLTDRLEAAEARLAALDGDAVDTDAQTAGPWPARGTIVGEVTGDECDAWLDGGNQEYALPYPGLDASPAPPASVWRYHPDTGVAWEIADAAFRCDDVGCAYEFACARGARVVVVIN